MKRLTLADILCQLRDDVVAARATNDLDTLDQLDHVINYLVTMAEKCEDGAALWLLTDLSDAIRDSFAGVRWKSQVPSHATIRSRLAGGDVVT